MFDELRASLHATSLVGLVLAAAMGIPAAVDFAYGNPAWPDFIVAMFLTAFFWLIIAISTYRTPPRFTTRFGLMLVNMLWWVLPATVVAPLMLGPAHLSLTDALFETASGFTTTGSTVISGLDSLDPGTLVWRSLIQWFGGLGILSVGLLLLPFLKVGGLQLFRLESSEKNDKPLPRFAEFTKSILIVYSVLTSLCALGFWLTGMSPFDAINHAMTTLSTGGYSTHDASMGYFKNDSTLWVGTIFMALGGLPFTLFVLMAFTRQRSMRDPQVLGFFTIIFVAVLLLVIERSTETVYSFHSITEDFFNVVSIITTTGFTTGDYTVWGGMTIPLFFFLTFFGGCSGSTAGGIKIYRFVVMLEMVRGGLRELIYPNGVFLVRYGGQRVDAAIFSSAMIMSIAFSGVLGLSTLLLGAQGNDFITAMSGSLTALANVGPGLGSIIGPAGNFSSLPDASKIVLSIDMISGRLEIMVVLALFMPMLWRHY